MGKLIEQSIPTMFQGVSRQPPSVRLPGQLEEGVNALFSVVTGGFEKRPGTRLDLSVTGITASDDLFVYSYTRDDTERYIITIDPATGTLRVFDLVAGVERSVSTPDGVGYLSAAAGSLDFSATTLADTTLIANGAVETALDPLSVAPPAPSMAVIYVAGSDAGTYRVRIDDVEQYAGVAVAGADTYDIAADMRSVLATNLGSDWLVEHSGSYVILTQLSDLPFTVETGDPLGDAYLKAVHDSVPASSALPARAKGGMVVAVGTADTKFYMKFVETEHHQGYWEETIEPGRINNFDAATMPHKLVREADGNFTFSRVSWNALEVGDEDSVPTPDFVGFGISDVVFFRNRLWLVSDENIYSSVSGDFYNFWPSRSTQTNDDDPIGRAASGQKVSILHFAVPFRKSLFATSALTQFSLFAREAMTPTTAVFASATEYAASTRARPVVHAEDLFFAADLGDDTGSSSVIWEYFDDEDVDGHTLANDVTKHVGGYIPSPVTSLVSDTTSGTLFVLTDGAPGSVFVYRTYWSGNAKAQSSWGRWDFGGTIHGIAFIGARLYLLITRNGETTIESLSMDRKFLDPKEMFPTRLDRRVYLTGTYDAGTERTTWTLPYKHANAVDVVYSDDFPGGVKGMDFTPEYVGEYSFRTEGDYSAGEVIAGSRYDVDCELSKIFLRGSDDSSVTTGRLQLRYLYVDYVDSGGFRVEVTPEFRDTKVWKFNGRKLGDGDNIIGVPAIDDQGRFRVKINSNAATVRIRFRNDTPRPFVITSLRWVGFFNEITRQE